MNKDDIQLLYAYDRWANDRVLEAASALSDEQFTRDLRGSFRSVRDTLVHIIAGEWGWLSYWKEPMHSPAFLADLRSRRDAMFAPDGFPNVASVQLKMGRSREGTKRVRESPDRTSPGKNASFSKDAAQLGPLDAASGDHSTYHRGQIALMMRQLGAEPLATDFHVFLIEGRSER